MENVPHNNAQHEPTKKQLWLAAFTSLLTRMDPEEAVQTADKALELCNERWKEPEWVWSWNYKHNFPVGHQFIKGLRPADAKTQDTDGMERAS
jgi:hypothetical protein